MTHIIAWQGAAWSALLLQVRMLPGKVTECPIQVWRSARRRVYHLPFSLSAEI